MASNDSYIHDTKPDASRSDPTQPDIHLKAGDFGDLSPRGEQQPQNTQPDTTLPDPLSERFRKLPDVLPPEEDEKPTPDTQPDIGEEELNEADFESVEEVSSGWRKRFSNFVREHVRGEAVERVEKVSKTDVAKTIGAGALGAVGSILGVKSFIDLPRYVSQKYFTAQEKKRLQKAFESSEEKDAGEERALSDLEKILFDYATEKRALESAEEKELGAEVLDEMREKMRDLSERAGALLWKYSDIFTHQKEILKQKRTGFEKAQDVEYASAEDTLRYIGIKDTALSDFFFEELRKQGMMGGGKTVTESWENTLAAKVQEIKDKRAQESAPGALRRLQQETEEQVDVSKYLTAEQKSKLKDRIGSILKEAENEDRLLNEEEKKDIAAIIDDSIETRVKGVTVFKESLNTFLTGTGLLAARGLVYGGVSLLERAQRIEKERRTEGKEWGAKDQLKDVFAKGFAETWNELLFRAEGGKTRKLMKAAQAMGTIMRFVGIGGTAVSEYADEGALSGSIDVLLKAWEEKSAGEFVADNFKENITRLGKWFSIGEVRAASVAPNVAEVKAVLASSGVPTSAPEFEFASEPTLSAEAEPEFKSPSSIEALVEKGASPSALVVIEDEQDFMGGGMEHPSTPTEIASAVYETSEEQGLGAEKMQGISGPTEAEIEAKRVPEVAAVLAAHEAARDSAPNFSSQHNLLAKHAEIHEEGERITVEIELGKGREFKFLDQALRRVVVDAFPEGYFDEEFSAVKAARAEAVLFKIRELALGRDVGGERAKEWADCLKYDAANRTFRITDYERFEERTQGLISRAAERINEKSLMMAYVDNTGRRTWQGIIDERLAGERETKVPEYAADGNVTAAEEKVFHGIFDKKEYLTYDLSNIHSFADEDSGRFVFDNHAITVRNGFIIGADGREDARVNVYDASAVREYLDSFSRSGGRGRKFDLETIVNETGEKERVTLPGLNLSEERWAEIRDMTLKDFIREYEKGQITVAWNWSEMRLAERLQDAGYSKAESELTVREFLERHKDALHYGEEISRDKLLTLKSAWDQGGYEGDSAKKMFLQDMFGIKESEIESVGDMKKEGGRIICEGVKLKGGAIGSADIAISLKTRSITVDTPGTSPDALLLNDKNLEEAAKILRRASKKLENPYEEARGKNISPI